jgi:hypothetical protein
VTRSSRRASHEFSEVFGETDPVQFPDEFFFAAKCPDLSNFAALNPQSMIRPLPSMRASSAFATFQSSSAI